ncbi:MAG: hypothetical protein ACWGSQ_16180, partial [Longimicrobiales bacterium]
MPVATVNDIVRVVDGPLPFPVAVTTHRMAGGSGGPHSLETHQGVGWRPSLAGPARAPGIEVREVNRPGAFSRLRGIRHFSSRGESKGGADSDREGSAPGAGRWPRGREGGMDDSSGGPKSWLGRGMAPGPPVRVPTFFTLALGAVFFAGCGRGAGPGSEGAAPDRSELPDPTTFSREASSQLGMVVSGNPYAS